MKFNTYGDKREKKSASYTWENSINASIVILNVRAQAINLLINPLFNQRHNDYERLQDQN